MSWINHKEKIEKRAKERREALAKADDILRNDDITDDKKSEVKSLQDLAAKLREQIELLEAQSRATSELTDEDEEEEVVEGEPTPEDEEEEDDASRSSRKAPAIAKFNVRTSKKSGPKSARDQAFGKYVRGLRLSEREARALETRALTAAGAELGAELVPQGVFEGYYNVLREESVVRKLNCDVSIVTNTRETPYPIYDDTANEAEIIGEHTGPDATSADPETGELVLGSKIFAAVFTLGRKFIRNAAGNAEQEVAKMGAQRIAIRQDRYFTAAMLAGATVPEGLQLVTPTLTYDILINFIDSMSAPYQKDMVLMGNRKTKNAIKKLKNSSGDNIWFSGIAGRPGDPWVSKVEGIDFVENPYLPDLEYGSTGSLLLVNPKRFKIQELAGAELLVNPYTNSKKYSIEYGWYHESDGGVLDANGFKALGVDEEDA